MAKEGSKKEAQYFFADSTTKVSYYSYVSELDLLSRPRPIIKIRCTF